MSRKVILDCDPGIDDAVAITMALFDPRLDVVAITAVAGNVSATQATANVQAIVEQLDPPRYPRLGAAMAPENLLASPANHLHGEDGLGNAGFAISQLARQHASDKLICDEVRAASGEITLVCLGPLTNLARALQRDPDLVDHLSRVVIMGGSTCGIGNITPVAEYNIHCDPVSAKQVFHSIAHKTLIPLDITSQVQFSLDFFDQLPSEDSRAGRFLRKVIPFLYRSHRLELGQECIQLPDAVALAAVLQPELFTLQDLFGDVETQGELTLGQTTFDRRPNRSRQTNMEVAMEVDAVAVADTIARCLQEAAKQT